MARGHRAKRAGLLSCTTLASLQTASLHPCITASPYPLLYPPSAHSPALRAGGLQGKLSVWISRLLSVSVRALATFSHCLRWLCFPLSWVRSSLACVPSARLPSAERCWQMVGGLGVGLPWLRAKGCASRRNARPTNSSLKPRPYGLVLWACLYVPVPTWHVLLWWWRWLWLFLLLFGPMTTEASLAGGCFPLLAVSRLPDRKFS